jgi:hypothetical protein
MRAAVPARRTDVRGGLDFEFVGRDADDTDGRPVLRRPWLEVVSNATDDIPPARDRPAVHDLEVGGLRPIVDAFAFGTQPQLVGVGADPRLPFPRQSVAMVGVEGF